MALVIPSPSPTCPGLAGPITVPPGTDKLTAGGDQISSMTGTFPAWIGKPSSMANDVGGWMTYNLFGYNPASPSCYQPSSPYSAARSVLLGDVDLTGSPVYHDIYS